MKQTLSLLLLSAILITACKKDGSQQQSLSTATEVKLQSITLDNTLVTLKIGETQQLNATLSPANASDKVITYTSSDTTIAKVSNTGLIKAIKSGAATISATNIKYGVVAQCKVTVPVVVVTSITIKSETLTIYSLGYTYQLTATVLPINAANTKLAWYSSDPSKVSINSDGMITTIADGTAIITAKSTDGSNVTSTNCTVIVNSKK